MQSRNNKGDLTVVIRDRLMENGDCVTTDTLYEHGQRVSQIITICDKRGRTRTEHVVFEQKHTQGVGGCTRNYASLKTK
jgi:hypothetical protein